VRQGMAAQIDQRGRMIDLLREEFRKPNSKDCYRSKIFEWFEYRDYVAPLTDESVRYHVKFEHVFDFVFYTCFREKREKKDCNKRKRNAGDYLYFVPEDYENIIATKGIEHSRGEPISEPKDGIQYSFFEQLRSCMLFLHKEQITLKTTSISWAEIWTDRLEAIGKLVQTRKRRQDRNNFSEKVDVATAPYTVLEKIKLVEKWYWDHASFTNDRRTAFAAFWARYMFLWTRQAILRGESVILEEFSDFLGVEIKCAKDPHTMEIFVSQISQGKTNGIYKLFGRSCRHRDVFQCAYSALGMWLAYRFHCTGEMEPPNCPNFCVREEWFRIKCLVGLNNFAETKEKGVNDSAYTTLLNKALKDLLISVFKQLHIGRYTMSCDLETSLTTDDIRNLGNWDPTVQEKAYSGKLPYNAIRVAGGYEETGGVYWNVRKLVEPSAALQAAFKEFAFADDWLPVCRNYHADESHKDTSMTAICFLEFIQNLRRVVLQDCAYILEFHPERAHNPIYGLSVFHTDEFASFRAQVRVACERAALERPTDQGLEAVLPGVLQHLKEAAEATRAVGSHVQEMRKEMRQRFDHTDHLVATASYTSMERTSAAFRAAADSLSPTDTADAENEQPNNEADSTPLTTQQTITAAQHFAGYKYEPNWKDMNCARAIYNQWTGLGNYVNVPIEGGVEALEKKYGNKWRPWSSTSRDKGGDPKKQKTFSRMKKICEEVDRLVTDDNHSLVQAFAYQNRALKRFKYSGYADKIGFKKISKEDLYNYAEELQPNEVAVAAPAPVAVAAPAPAPTGPAASTPTRPRPSPARTSATDDSEEESEALHTARTSPSSPGSQSSTLTNDSYQEQDCSYTHADGTTVLYAEI